MTIAFFQYFKSSISIFFLSTSQNSLPFLSPLFWFMLTNQALILLILVMPWRYEDYYLRSINLKVFQLPLCSLMNLSLESRSQDFQCAQLESFVHLCIASSSPYGKRSGYLWVDEFIELYLHISEIYALLAFVKQRRHARASITLFLAGRILNWLHFIARDVFWDSNRTRITLWVNLMIFLCK